MQRIKKIVWIVDILPASVDKFHWFYRQHGGNYVICIMSSTWDLHQTLLTTTNENKTTLKQGKMIITMVQQLKWWQLCLQPEIYIKQSFVE